MKEDDMATKEWILVLGEFPLSFWRALLSRRPSLVYFRTTDNCTTIYHPLPPPRLLISTSVFLTPTHAYRHNIHHNQDRSKLTQNISVPINPSLSLPLLMFRIQWADDIHMSLALLAAFPSYRLNHIVSLSSLCDSIFVHGTAMALHSLCPSPFLTESLK
jgi:hypothetical protein